MLVFTRAPDDEIVIGNDIRIRILAIHGSTVKLGITAPRQITIHRGEVWEQIARQNLAAARSAEALDLPLGGILPAAPQVPARPADTPLGGLTGGTEQEGHPSASSCSRERREYHGGGTDAATPTSRRK